MPIFEKYLKIKGFNYSIPFGIEIAIVQITGKYFCRECR